MPIFLPNPQNLRLVARFLLAFGVLEILDWILFGHKLLGNLPFFSQLSLYTATLTVLCSGHILISNQSRYSLSLPLAGIAVCLFLALPNIQKNMNFGTASPGTLYSFGMLFASALVSKLTQRRALQALYFLMFTSIQAVGVIGLSQFFLKISDMGHHGLFAHLSPSTSLIILLLSPLMFVQSSFGVLDPKRKENIAHQNMAGALFLLPIFLALLAVLPPWLQAITEGTSVLPFILGLATLLACWFLYYFGTYAGEKEQETREKLRQQSEKLEQLYSERLENAYQSAEEQRRFSSVLAHEIRTPLSTVLGLVDILKIRKSSDLQRIGCFDDLVQIESSAKLLREMINSVLDYAKLKDGKLVLTLQSTPIKPFIEELVSIYAPVAKNKGIDLAYTLSEKCPSAVKMDTVRVREILSNLIDNALKFTSQDGTVFVHSECIVTQEKANILFVVEDSGIGITPEQSQHIFQPFRQASEGISRKFGGTGLGLSYSLELAHFMGGELTVESEIDKGSRFILSLPLVNSQADKPKLTTQPTGNALGPEAEATGQTNLSLKALMVEDHNLNAMIHGKLLNSIGVDCDWVDSGEAALKKVQDPETYDLILMDINLGEGMNGIQTTQKLRERFGSKLPPIFALTAGTMDQEIEDLKQAGITNVIPKPIELKTVKAQLGGMFKSVG